MSRLLHPSYDAWKTSPPEDDYEDKYHFDPFDDSDEYYNEDAAYERWRDEQLLEVRR